jgi:hypothetical protein
MITVWRVRAAWVVLRELGHGEWRANYTRVSTTDPDDRLARKGAGQGAAVVFHGARLTFRNDGPIEMR